MATDNIRNLTLVPGTGNIAFIGAVGSNHPLNVLTISNANNVTTSAAVNVASLVQASGNGATTFNGPLSTTNVLGINLTGANFTFNSSVTTTNAGPFVITNSGRLLLIQVRPSTSVMN